MGISFTQVRALHTFDTPFTESSGPQVITQFTFDSKGTNTAGFLRAAMSMLEESRNSGNSASTHEDHLQIVFILSDGRVLEKNVDKVKYTLRFVTTSSLR